MPEQPPQHLRSPRPRLGRLLHDDGGGTLRHHEAVAVGAERPGGVGRLLFGQRAHPGEAGDDEGVTAASVPQTTTVSQTPASSSVLPSPNAEAPEAQAAATV